MALRYIHKEKHIVHRDLTPNNIMLGENDKVTISTLDLLYVITAFLFPLSAFYLLACLSACVLFLLLPPSFPPSFPPFLLSSFPPSLLSSLLPSPSLSGIKLITKLKRVHFHTIHLKSQLTLQLTSDLPSKETQMQANSLQLWGLSYIAGTLYFCLLNWQSRISGKGRRRRIAFG